MKMLIKSILILVILLNFNVLVSEATVLSEAGVFSGWGKNICREGLNTNRSFDNFKIEMYTIIFKKQDSTLPPIEKVDWEEFTEEYYASRNIL